MAVKTGIAFNMHGAHVPVFTTNDVVGRILIEFGYNRLFASGNECSIKAGIPTLMVFLNLNEFIT
jgi:hypothetical protein